MKQTKWERTRRISFLLTNAPGVGRLNRKKSTSLNPRPRPSSSPLIQHLPVIAVKFKVNATSCDPERA